MHCVIATKFKWEQGSSAPSLSLVHKSDSHKKYGMSQGIFVQCPNISRCVLSSFLTSFSHHQPVGTDEILAPLSDKKHFWEIILIINSDDCLALTHVCTFSLSVLCFTMWSGLLFVISYNSMVNGSADISSVCYMCYRGHWAAIWTHHAYKCR